MRTITRAGWLLLPLVVVGTAPTLPASSEEQHAGVVTAVQGTASVARASLPERRVLTFKDDVYLRDEIVTGDASMARILLGGKALLTVRERSMVRITESPGVSTVAVTSGRAAVNVIKERMRAGDRVEIVTPNATAAIRGTIVVAEVEGSEGTTRSTITVLRGLIDVTQHDASGMPFGSPVSVSALQQVQAVGSQLSPVQTITRQTGDQLATEFKMGLRSVPAAPAVVQSEVDRAVQQIAAVKDTSKDAGKDKDSQDSGKDSGKDDNAKDTAKDDGKDNGKDSAKDAGKDGGDKGKDRSAGGKDRIAGGGSLDRFAGGGGGAGDRDRDSDSDRDRDRVKTKEPKEPKAPKDPKPKPR